MYFDETAPASVRLLIVTGRGSYDVLGYNRWSVSGMPECAAAEYKTVAPHMRNRNMASEMAKIMYAGVASIQCLQFINAPSEVNGYTHAVNFNYHAAIATKFGFNYVTFSDVTEDGELLLFPYGGKVALQLAGESLVAWIKLMDG